MSDLHLAAAAPVAEQAPISIDEAEADTSASRNRDDGLAIQTPIDVRSVSLAVIATILSLYALQWAKEVVVPILAGVMLSYALTPIVTRLQRFFIPRVVGATLVLSLIVGLLGWGATALGDQADALIDTVPAVTQRLREISYRVTGKSSTIERMRNAANELTAAAAASQPAASAPSPRSARNVAAPMAPGATEPPIDVRGYLLSGTVGALSFLAKLAVIFFVALFVMASGNNFRRKMVKLAGKKWSQKRVTVETLDEISEQIQRYLIVQVGVSIVVGICTWLAFMLLGLHNAGVWGVAAGATNLVPYLGAVVLSGGATIVALVQFGTPEMAFSVGAASLVIHTVVSNALTPWWTGRASKMSPVAVFVSVLVFGWLWGVWGLLLGVPVLLVVKSVCDRVEDLKPVGELLGA